ncbi:hypothetical protein U1Q18_005606 [Sarracenia purpurea var. burkii]
MSTTNDPTKKADESPPPSTAPPAGDMENQVPVSWTVSGIVRRWKREDLLKRGSFGLRGLALLFSILAFIIMASNNHRDWQKFNNYEEYRYVVAIAIISTLYTGGQALRQAREFSTGKQLLSERNLALVDFFGDQIVAYLLISAASSAVPLTNRMREGADNIFTDSSTAAISMEFLAFFALAFSAMISGYKLSNRSYI